MTRTEEKKSHSKACILLRMSKANETKSQLKKHQSSINNGTLAFDLEQR